MSKILVVYATNSGSTGEVAEAIADELNKQGHVADVRSVNAVREISEYESIIIGAPMIFGWHNDARKFVRKHQQELAGKKVTYFVCAMRLTQVNMESLPVIPLSLDPNLVSEPAKTGSLNIKERFTTIGHYLKPMLQSAPLVKPLSVAFFNGNLEMYRLKWWQALFVMLVVQAPPGDYRDWNFIRFWVKSLTL